MDSAKFSAKELSYSNAEGIWEGKIILVAEDELTNFVLIKTALSKTKAEIIRAVNGKEAVEYIKKHKFVDIILMDIKMPIMNGIEATQEIKKMNKDIKIVIQSAYAFNEDKEKCFNAGCDDFIVKPIEINTLFLTVAKYIN